MIDWSGCTLGLQGLQNDRQRSHFQHEQHACSNGNIKVHSASHSLSLDPLTSPHYSLCLCHLLVFVSSDSHTEMSLRPVVSVSVHCSRIHVQCNRCRCDRVYVGYELILSLHQTTGGHVWPQDTTTAPPDGNEGKNTWWEIAATFLSKRVSLECLSIASYFLSQSQGATLRVSPTVLCS